ncbi:hypothetical protein CHUAL_004883 [Chamberlinius hualienensis]
MGIIVCTLFGLILLMPWYVTAPPATDFTFAAVQPIEILAGTEVILTAISLNSSTIFKLLETVLANVSLENREYIEEIVFQALDAVRLILKHLRSLISSFTGIAAPT